MGREQQYIVKSERILSDSQHLGNPAKAAYY